MSKPHKKLWVGSAQPRDLRWVLQAEAAGSLSAAAQKFGASQSTVSRAVGRAEQALEVRFFVRSGRDFHLTEDGSRLLPHIRRLLGAMDRLQSAAREQKNNVAGELRLSLCGTLGRHVFLPHLLRWQARCTELRLDIRLEERWFDPRHVGIDLMVRAGKVPDSELQRTFLGRYGHILVAAPRLAEQLDLSTPEDLAAAPTATLRLERPWTTWVFRKANRKVKVMIRPQLTVTHVDALRDAGIFGAGVTVLPDYLAHPAIKTGRLVALLTEWRLPVVPAYALHQGVANMPAIVGEALAQLQQAFAEASAH